MQVFFEEVVKKQTLIWMNTKYAALMQNTCINNEHVFEIVLHMIHCTHELKHYINNWTWKDETQISSKILLTTINIRNIVTKSPWCFTSVSVSIFCNKNSNHCIETYTLLKENTLASCWKRKCICASICLKQLVKRDALCLIQNDLIYIYTTSTLHCIPNTVYSILNVSASTDHNYWIKACTIHLVELNNMPQT